MAPKLACGMMIGGFAVYAIAFTVSLVALCLAYPLTDWATHDLDWTREWLFQTCYDYYGLAAVLCAVVGANERKAWQAVLWGLGICFLGCPFALVWAMKNLYLTGTIIPGGGVPSRQAPYTPIDRS